MFTSARPNISNQRKHLEIFLYFQVLDIAFINPKNIYMEILGLTGAGPGVSKPRKKKHVQNEDFDMSESHATKKPKVRHLTYGLPVLFYLA